MATYADLLSVLQRSREESAAVPSSLDKVNRLFGTIKSGADEFQKNQILQTQQELQRLQTESEKMKIAAAKTSAQPLGVRMGGYTPEQLENIRKFKELGSRVAPGATDLNRATAGTMPPDLRKQESQVKSYEDFKTKLGLDPSLSLSENKDMADIGLKKATADSRLNKTNLNDLSPVIASDEDEISTGGLVVAGTQTTIGAIKRLAQLNRTDIIASAASGRQSLREKFQEAQQKRSFEQKEEAEQRSNRKKQLDEISDAESGFSAYVKELGKVPPGPIGGAQTVASKTGLAFPEAATADRTRNAFSVNLYRALTGDTRLSDVDAASRAIPLLPAAYQDSGQRNRLINFINNRLNERKNRINRGITGPSPLPSPADAFKEVGGVQDSPMLMEDANGNKAYVYPDGRIEELQ